MNLEEFRTKLFGMSGLATVEKAFELYSELEAENEKLKAELKQTEAQDQVVIDRLRKEIAKLKCLALHAMSEWLWALGVLANTKVGDFLDPPVDIKLCESLGQKYYKAYRKAKAELKEGK